MLIRGGSRTPWALVKFGVPQGSVLSPLVHGHVSGHALWSARSYWPHCCFFSRFAPLPSCLTTFLDSHSTRILLKVLTLIFRQYIGHVPKYLPDLIRPTSSAISLRPLRSFARRASRSNDQERLRLRHEPLQSPAMYFGTNSVPFRLPPYYKEHQWAKCLFSFSQDSSRLSMSLALEELLNSDWCALREALYKFIDTMQCNCMNTM